MRNLFNILNVSFNFPGWYVTYIDRDPETLAAQEKKAKKEKMDKDDEERLMDFIEKQIERNAKQDAPTEEENETFKTPLMRSENDAPLVLDIKLKPKPKLLPVLNIKQEKKSENISNQDQPVSSKSLDEKEKSKRSIYDETKSVKKLKSDNNPPEIEGWLKEDLMVKVTTKSLGDKYYKSKGVVQSVEKDGFVAKVKLKTPDEVEGHIIRLDQEYLETVIPAIGKEVLILWGKHKSKIAIVKKLHIEHYSIDVELKKDKKVVEKLPYEQVCKYVD